MEPVEFVPAPAIADTPADYHPPYQRPEDVAREFLTIPMSNELPYRADLRTNLPFTEIASPFQYFRLLLADAALNLIVLNTNAYAARKIATFEAAGKSLRDWQPLNEYDIQLWIGIILFMGLRNVQQPDVCWSEHSRIWQIADHMPL